MPRERRFKTLVKSIGPCQPAQADMNRYFSLSLIVQYVKEPFYIHDSVNCLAISFMASL